MVSLAEQTKNVFGEKPVEIPQMGLPAPLPDPYSPEIKKLRKQIFTKDLPRALPRVVKGAALSIPAIPSDLVDLAKLANDLNNQYGPDFITQSPVTKFFTKAVDKTQQTVGREQFSKLMKSIGINDNPNDPAQLIGELSTVLIALPTVISKGLSKTSKVTPPKSTTAIDKPKQTALSKKVDDTAPKDPSKRKFLKGVAGTAGAITAAPLIKASSLIPKADIATAIQKSYQSLVPAIQKFRAEKFVLDDNLDTFFDLRDSGNIQDKFFKIKQATDSAGKPMQQYYQYDYDTETQNLEELKNKNIQDREAIKIGLDQHTQILETYKKQISKDLNIPLNDILIVKNKREVSQNAFLDRKYSADFDIQDVDTLSSTTTGKAGSIEFDRTHFNDGGVIINQAWLTPDGVVVTNQQRLQGMAESISKIRNPKKHIQIKQDLTAVVNEYKYLLDLIFDKKPDYKKFGSEAQYEFYGYDDRIEELMEIARQTESTINPDIFEKIMYSIVQGKATKMNDLGIENFENGRIAYFVDKFYDYFAKDDVRRFGGELEGVDGIFKIFNFMNNPNLNNITDKKLIFLKDFYDQHVFKNRGTLDLNATNIFDKLDLNMSKAFKSVRTTIGSKNVYENSLGNTILDETNDDVIQDSIREYSGTGMYESNDVGFPTKDELNQLPEDTIGRLTNLENLYIDIKRALPSIKYYGSGSGYGRARRRDLITTDNNDFQSDKLLSFLKYFNARTKPNLKEGQISGIFVAPKDLNKYDFDFENTRLSGDSIYSINAQLKKAYMNLVRYKGMPIEKARDLVNQEFKKAVNASYLSRLNTYTTVFSQSINKNTIKQMQEKYLKQAKLLDVSLPTSGVDTQLAINFSKTNKYVNTKGLENLQKKSQAGKTDTLYENIKGELSYPYDKQLTSLIDSIELSTDEIAKSLTNKFKTLNNLTDQTTRLLKGADKAMTALEAPKVKYTKDVYHLGKGEIVGDKFDFMGDSDIGVHVGTQAHAKGASKKYFVEDGKTTDPTVDFVPDKKEDVLLKGKYKVKGQRTFPLQLADDLKPARVPDIGLFKRPQFWIDTLSIPSTDAYRMDVATTDAQGNETLEAMTKFQKKPTLEYKGVTYYMSDKAVNIDMDKKLWADFVKAAVDEQAKFKKQKIFGATERKEWFEKLKKITNDNGYNSLIYKNEKEASQTQKATDKYEDSFMLFEPDQVKYKFAKTQTKGDPRLDRYKGGMI